MTRRQDTRDTTEGEGFGQRHTHTETQDKTETKNKRSHDDTSLLEDMDQGKFNVYLT